MKLKKIQLPFKVKKPILALGSQTKNTVCFSRDNLAIFSALHPDLSHYRDFLNFQKSVKYFLKKKPKIIAYDLHPEYQSTKYAQDLDTRHYTLYAIQHHHAHIASCMAENGMKNQKVIGVAFDGTGLGIDNTLWGAEFLCCDYRSFKRRAHLREVSLLGREKAILEPWRLAAIWLYLIYKDKFLNLGIDFLNDMPGNQWRVLKKMYLAGFNSVLVSSMGRLFDAVASLVLAKYKANFEAELAMDLEKIATRYKRQARSYNFKITKQKDEYVIDPAPMFKEIISDLRQKKTQQKIAYQFHFTVAEMLRKACLILRKETRINKVVLSGGVFQNKLLLFLSLAALDKEGFRVFRHQDLSCNDSSLPLGQLAIANSRS